MVDGNKMTDEEILDFFKSIPSENLDEFLQISTNEDLLTFFDVLCSSLSNESELDEKVKYGIVKQEILSRMEKR